MKQQLSHSLAAAAILLAAIVPAWGQENAVPRYLQLARDFVANTRPENNAYSNSKAYTRMPGDLLASEYVVSTDCSGFVEDMFRRAGDGVVGQLKTQKLKTRHSLLDYHASIQREEAFTRIMKVTDIQPGDVAAWRYLDMAAHQLSGHILFVDSAPVKIKPRKPHVDGLDQYEFALIDTSQEAKSRDDTRYVSDEALRDANEARGKERGTMVSRNYKGVGRGHMRFYADGEGHIKGAAFSFGAAKFHPHGGDWDIVVGRPRTSASSSAR
ncbi:hypothetical protein [Delftia sp. PS-11]|uniref:hypothetical protein n=1 Tax=Delftia sp. PS-11 TaxID=2767222 RepID=UPI002458E800|nr:hypothetical protein [Delftia sp. PS-11]KAJ8744660.1 hypothetical protein H9T68_10560 [Delftia sp. PS-11]